MSILHICPQGGKHSSFPGRAYHLSEQGQDCLSTGLFLHGEAGVPDLLILWLCRKWQLSQTQLLSCCANRLLGWEANKWEPDRNGGWESGSIRGGNGGRATESGNLKKRAAYPPQHYIEARQAGALRVQKPYPEPLLLLRVLENEFHIETSSRNVCRSTPIQSYYKKRREYGTEANPCRWPTPARKSCPKGLKRNISK